MHIAVRRRYGSLSAFYAVLRRRPLPIPIASIVDDVNDDDELQGRLDALLIDDEAVNREPEVSGEEVREIEFEENEHSSPQASSVLVPDHGQYRVQDDISEDCSICVECERRHGVNTIHAAIENVPEDSISIEGEGGFISEGPTGLARSPDIQIVDGDEIGRADDDVGDQESEIAKDDDDNEVRVVSETRGGDDDEILFNISEIVDEILNAGDESNNYDDDDNNNGGGDENPFISSDPSWETMIAQGGGSGLDSVSIPSTFEAAQAYYHLI